MAEPAESPEPTYIAQSFEPMTTTQAQEWFRDRFDEAKERGCAFGRYTHNPKTGGYLVEGWDTQPADQGEPRWQMTYAKEPDNA